jgi:hypothetical protein
MLHRASDLGGFYRTLQATENILVENLLGTDPCEDLGVDGRIIFEWILRK